MKRKINRINVACLVLINLIFTLQSHANTIYIDTLQTDTSAPVLFKPQHDFKYKDGNFNLEIERKGKKVIIYLLVEDLSEYKEVFIQRSDETMLGTGNCKYISPRDFKLQKLTEVIFEDKYALPAHKNAYYRVRTEDKDGVIRTYPWILLPEINLE